MLTAPHLMCLLNFFLSSCFQSVGRLLSPLQIHPERRGGLTPSGAILNQWGLKQGDKWPSLPDAVKFRSEATANSFMLVFLLFLTRSPSSFTLASEDYSLINYLHPASFSFSAFSRGTQTKAVSLKTYPRL